MIHHLNFSPYLSISFLSFLLPQPHSLYSFSLTFIFIVYLHHSHHSPTSIHSINLPSIPSIPPSLLLYSILIIFILIIPSYTVIFHCSYRYRLNIHCCPPFTLIFPILSFPTTSSFLSSSLSPTLFKLISVHHLSPSISIVDSHHYLFHYCPPQLSALTSYSHRSLIAIAIILADTLFPHLITYLLSPLLSPRTFLFISIVFHFILTALLFHSNQSFHL